MKSIIFILALGTFMTVKPASIPELQTNHYLTSVEKNKINSEEVLPKLKKVKTAAEELSYDVENLKHQKTIEEVIAEDIKVIENNSFDTELTAIEHLKRQKSIQETIIDDLKIIERNNFLSLQS